MPATKARRKRGLTFKQLVKAVNRAVYIRTALDTGYLTDGRWITKMTDIESDKLRKAFARKKEIRNARPLVGATKKFLKDADTDGPALAFAGKMHATNKDRLVILKTAAGTPLYMKAEFYETLSRRHTGGEWFAQGFEDMGTKPLVLRVGGEVVALCMPYQHQVEA